MLRVVGVLALRSIDLQHSAAIRLVQGLAGPNTAQRVGTRIIRALFYSNLLTSGVECVISVRYVEVFMLKSRTDKGDLKQPRVLANAILGDVHFWIPVIVLAGGLVVLRWVS